MKHKILNNNEKHKKSFDLLGASWFATEYRNDWLYIMCKIKTIIA